MPCVTLQDFGPEQKLRLDFSLYIYFYLIRRLCHNLNMILGKLIRLNRDYNCKKI